jgi:hypothetical protein
LKKRVPNAKDGKGPRWEEFTGHEEIAARAAGLSDGQSVEMNVAGK